MKLGAMWVAGALLCGGTALADESEARRNRLTFGPASLLFGAVTLEYERVLGDAFSVFVGARIEPQSGLGLIGSVGGVYWPEQLGAGGSAGIRIYPEGRALSGLWAGPEFYAIRQQLSLKYAGSINQYNTTAAGLVMLGYSFLYPGGFSFSLGGGLGPGVASWNASPIDSEIVPYKGAFLSVGLNANVGWAF
jgi:hypothetical protein